VIIIYHQFIWPDQEWIGYCWGWWEPWHLDRTSLAASINADPLHVLWIPESRTYKVYTKVDCIRFSTHIAAFQVQCTKWQETNERSHMFYMEDLFIVIPAHCGRGRGVDIHLLSPSTIGLLVLGPDQRVDLWLLRTYTRLNWHIRVNLKSSRRGSSQCITSSTQDYTKSVTD